MTWMCLQGVSQMIPGCWLKILVTTNRASCLQDIAGVWSQVSSSECESLVSRTQYYDCNGTLFSQWRSASALVPSFDPKASPIFEVCKDLQSALEECFRMCVYHPLSNNLDNEYKNPIVLILGVGVILCCSFGLVRAAKLFFDRREDTNYAAMPRQAA